MAEGGENRRHPHNLQGVLRLALEAGAAEEGPTPVQPMSEERKEWLRGALAEVSRGQMSEVEQMKRCLAVLQRDALNAEQSEGEEVQSNQEEEDERESALEILSELCENLDNARDLMTMGGLQLCVSRLMDDVQGGVRWRAAQLLASCAQNMPEVQLHLLSIHALPKLLQMCDSDPQAAVRVKALYSVSCLVREQEVGVEAFVSQDGFSVLMRGMQSEDQRLRTKSAFLLLSLLSANPQHKGAVLSMGMVEQLVSVLQMPHSSFHEHVIGALCCLVEDCPQGLKACRSTSLGLEELLRLRAKALHGREECQEELNFCQQLQAACFKEQQPDDNGMDR